LSNHKDSLKKSKDKQDSVEILDLTHYEYPPSEKKKIEKNIIEFIELVYFTVAIRANDDNLQKELF
jgi:hypothetical protein